MIDLRRSRATRIRPLRPTDLPSSRWGEPSALVGDGVPENQALAWARAAQREWGCCGLGYFPDDAATAVLLFCPPLFVPRSSPQAGGLNSDAAVVLTLAPVPGLGAAVARQLCQASLARIAKGPRAFRALEVRASRLGGDSQRPPLSLCLEAGFTLVDNHPATPRLRLDLSRTLRWTPKLSAVWDRLAGLPKPLPPEPASRQSPVARPGRATYPAQSPSIQGRVSTGPTDK